SPTHLRKTASPMEKLQFIQFAATILMAAEKARDSNSVWDRAIADDAVSAACSLWESLAHFGYIPDSEIDL
ncbi:MAG: hypothetical protein ACO3EZ_17655, partial [Prochlorotrichaceae cyanobacterium]